MLLTPSTRTFRVGHMACGIGAGAKGFNDANPRVGGVQARFECAGGIDVDPGAIRNFERLTGVPGTVLDLFSREQYVAFHGREPTPGWREALPDDIRRAFGGALPLDVLFASYPCKGFSGLLSGKASESNKYQALNGLTLRGMWLSLEAYKDDPVPIVLFENVPRIATRGRALLDQIAQLYRAYGYAVAETQHDCGEIGGLAQSRKRFLMVMRHREKVPPFLYQPTKSRLRGVGEVIGKLPLPGAAEAGAMHRVPMLQWKTWVRLAFVRSGADWRSLNDLAVENGMLRDYGIVPAADLRPNAYGVCGWDDSAPTITSARAPGQGRFAVADPRPNQGMHNEVLGVRGWREPTGTVAGASRPANGTYSVADPRYGDRDRDSTLGVNRWNEPAGTVQAKSGPTNGAFSVADPRPGYGPGTHKHVLRVTPFDGAAGTVTSGHSPSNGAQCVADPRRPEGRGEYGQYGVREWDEPTGAVTGQAQVGGGPNSVADPRLGRVAHNNVFRIVPFDAPAPAVTGPGGPGGLAVADPRSGTVFGGRGKYRVTSVDEPLGCVIASSTTGEGAFAVADPRCTWGADSHRNKLKVVDFDGQAPTVTGADRVGSGAPSVADPRRPHYQTAGHYGVVAWEETSGSVTASMGHDNGRGCVADPREPQGDATGVDALPAPSDRLVCRIIALDGTWHRPFTTLELAALQSLFDPDEVFDLEGGSDARKREWIGNAVPAAAARGMAETIGETLLLAGMGETFTLSSRAIWVKPLALALSVDGHAQELPGG